MIYRMYATDPLVALMHLGRCVDISTAVEQEAHDLELSAVRREQEGCPAVLRRGRG